MPWSLVAPLVRARARRLAARLRRRRKGPTFATSWTASRRARPSQRSASGQEQARSRAVRSGRARRTTSQTRRLALASSRLDPRSATRPASTAPSQRHSVRSRGGDVGDWHGAWSNAGSSPSSRSLRARPRRPARSGCVTTRLALNSDRRLMWLCCVIRFPVHRWSQRRSWTKKGLWVRGCRLYTCCVVRTFCLTRVRCAACRVLQSRRMCGRTTQMQKTHNRPRRAEEQTRTRRSFVRLPWPWARQRATPSHSLTWTVPQGRRAS